MASLRLPRRVGAAATGLWSWNISSASALAEAEQALVVTHRVPEKISIQLGVTSLAFCGWAAHRLPRAVGTRHHVIDQNRLSTVYAST
jgi:hypothetical protein